MWTLTAESTQTLQMQAKVPSQQSTDLALHQRDLQCLPKMIC